MKTGGLFKSNWTYLLWCACYVFIVWAILGMTAQAFMLTLTMYGISIFIALSPVGEKILRFMEGARPIATSREKDYLLPIFEEVYEEAKNKNPNLSRDIQLYIIDAMFVNAFAMGNNTIAVTKGITHTMTEEQLKGVLGHEFGHIANSDTKALLINVVGNGLFTVGIIVLRVMLGIIHGVAVAADSTGIGDLLLRFLKFVVNISAILFLYIGQVILSLNSRGNEYRADEFAYNLGYGEELTEALYLLQKMDMGGKGSLIDKLRATHPYLSDRIARLENMV